MTKASSTRAMRRALRRSGPLTAAEKRKLEAVDAAGREGIVLDEDVVGLVAEPGRVSFSVELEEASLNWNMAWDEIERSIVEADTALAKIESIGGRRRALARDTVIKTLDDNEHMDQHAATVVARMVVWLVFTGDNGDLLREARVTHAGYVITREPGGANFRLIAGT